MIFGVIQTDDKVQVADKFRISAVKSYVSKDEAAISLVEVQPEAGGDFIDVTGSSSKDWFLDWQYSSAGDKVITLRITTDGSPATVTKTVTAVTESTDNLFSDDDDLKLIDNEIFNYLPDGRATYKYMHREAQKNILEHLYSSGYRAANDTRIEASHFTDIADIKHWSKHATLALIYRDLSTIDDDIWERKAIKHESEAQKWASPIAMKFDYNGDGTLQKNEVLNLASIEVTRR